MWQRIDEVFRRLSMAMRAARVALVDDAGSVQLLQIKLGGDMVLTDVPRLAEYGFQSNPPADADAVMVCASGNPADAVVIATGHQTYRLKSLGPGEVGISDDKGQSIVLGANGITIRAAKGLDIEAPAGFTVNATSGMTINAPAGLDITAPAGMTINAPSGVVINGTLSATDVVFGGISGKQHTHGGVARDNYRTDGPQ